MINEIINQQTCSFISVRVTFVLLKISPLHSMQCVQTVQMVDTLQRRASSVKSGRQEDELN